MLALPVAGASAADTLLRSSQVTASEQAVRDMGRYDALVHSSTGTPMYQNATGSQSGPADPGASAPDRDPAAERAERADLAALLPPTAHVVGPMSHYDLSVIIVDRTGRNWASLREVDLADPQARGIAERRAGTAPTADDQVAISSELAGHLGKKVGDTIDVRLTDPAAAASGAAAGNGAAPGPKALRVTGIYDSNDNRYADLVFARRGTFQGGAERSSESYFVALPGGVDWSLVQKLNQRGFTVESKKVVADPPPHSRMPYYTSGMAARLDEGAGIRASIAVAMAVGVAMALLEVVLLAGPAFAVSARRRRRDFGLLGAAGADGRRLRRIVLADGVVLGLAGGLAGTGIGVLAAGIGLPYLAELARQNPGGFRVLPAELLAAAAVGVLTGVAAALAPAIVTARQDVLTALTGRRGQARPAWKLPIAGLAALVAGTALILVGSLTEIGTIPVVAGIAVAELGVVACTPLLVSWSGRLARMLPLTGRLAVRDGARNRGRTAPAVAAIMAAVAGTSAVAMILTSRDAQDRHDYVSDLRTGQAALSLTGMVQDPARLAAQIAALMPGSRYVIVNGVPVPTSEGNSGDGSQKTAPPTMMIPEIQRTVANACPRIPEDVSGGSLEIAVNRNQADPRCGFLRGRVVTRHYETGATPVVSGGPDVARAILGRSDPAAESVLKAGGIVVFDPLDLSTTGPSPTVQVKVSARCKQAECPATDSAATLPAAVIDAPDVWVRAIVAPGALAGLGITFTPQSIIFDTTRLPTAAEQKEADDLAGAAGISWNFYVERGYQEQTWVGLLALAAVAGVVMLGAAAVATGLAITDAQGDLETLSAVGARPRVRRALAGSQAATTAGLGALLGALFGLLPAIGLLEAMHRARTKDLVFGPAAEAAQLAVPWLFLALVVLALPMLAAVGAAGMTRSRITMRLRRD
ncbi:MAG: FtsX-like permease family protein [Catenulispora sp.]